MKLGYISDLHIDFNDRYDIIGHLISSAKRVGVDALAIAGDISNEMMTSRMAITRLEEELGIPIYWTNGNHEFYGQPYDEGFHSERAAMLTEDTVLFTTTGWYDYTWDSAGRVDELMKGKTQHGRWPDHKYINWETNKDERKGMNPTLWYNDQCITRLVNVWEEYKFVKNKILMMHMLPHKELLSDNPGHYQTNPFFGSTSMQKTIFNIIKPNTIIFGHTHFAKEVKINGIYCTCRPLGYANYEWSDPSERMYKIFDTMEIK